MRVIFLNIAAILMLLVQNGSIQFDKTVHDFGDVSVDDGPLTCVFTLSNTGTEAISIYEVASSCGCTGVTWTKELIQPGESGTISATYKNQDGAGAFDKTLTAYISGIKRPVVLRIRGVVHQKKKSLSELYGESRLGDFGMKSLEYKTGTVKQGLSSSGTATVANLGSKPMSVSFTDTDPNLSVSVSPNPIPAQGTATLTFTVKSNPQLWGRNYYSATPVLNGRKAYSPIRVMAFTQENFAGADDSLSPLPMFSCSTADLGILKKGVRREGSFSWKEKGKAGTVIYKIDSDNDTALKARAADGKVEFVLDTSALPEGENVIMLTLTTNSSQRPVIKLFVACIIQ